MTSQENIIFFFATAVCTASCLYVFYNFIVFLLSVYLAFRDKNVLQNFYRKVIEGIRRKITREYDRKIFSFLKISSLLLKRCQFQHQLKHIHEVFKATFQ